MSKSIFSTVRAVISLCSVLSYEIKHVFLLVSEQSVMYLTHSHLEVTLDCCLVAILLTEVTC